MRAVISHVGCFMNPGGGGGGGWWGGGGVRGGGGGGGGGGSVKVSGWRVCLVPRT